MSEITANLSKEPLFDIVVPVGPSDVEVISVQLQHTIQNIVGFRHIYILCYDSIIVKNALSEDFRSTNRSILIFIDDSIFPFSLVDIANIHGTHKRNAWYLQQLLKLYFPFVITDALDRYLVIDADTFFIRPTTFIDDDGAGPYLYNYSDEEHPPYFHHILRLHPSLIKKNTKSSICHHMLFEKKYIKEIFDLVEDGFDEPFWHIFLQRVDGNLRGDDPYPKSGASEYELYLNYMLNYHEDRVRIRHLDYSDITVNFLENKHLFSQYDYICWHNRFR